MRRLRALPRFTVGQLVRINDAISTRYIGREGTVVVVKPSPRARPKDTSLDKYTVAFSGDEQAEFFDIQLESV
jgi:hypothetical protein